MANTQARAIKTMTFARADQDTGAIVFRFECHDNSEPTFACPPDAVPEIADVNGDG